MATSENTVLVSFNVQLRSKQIVPWTILPVDRVNTNMCCLFAKIVELNWFALCF